MQSWSFRRAPRALRVSASLLLTLVLVLLVAHSLAASVAVADLTGSSKEVNLSQSLTGHTLSYTVVISNSGDATATSVWMTDTIPADLTYEDGTAAVSVVNGSTSSLTDDGGVVAWNGSLNPLGQAAVTFRAKLADTVMVGDTVVNTAEISGEGSPILRQASTEIVAPTSFSHMPLSFKILPAPVVSISSVSSTGNWTVSWNDVAPSVVDYELQEAQDMDFASPNVFNMGTALSRFFDKPSSTNNVYCYRVQAMAANGVRSNWSEVECVAGNYRDSFNDDSTGWRMVREDTDDVRNNVFYENDGILNLDVNGRWDYLIASPVMPAPAPPYVLEARIQLHDEENLNSYGLIFGGNLKDEPCPEKDFSTCFTHYYRLNVIWFGSSSTVKVQLKRIDFHSRDDNSGRGKTLWGTEDVRVGSPSEDWKLWRVEVDPDGDIRVFVKNKLLAEVNDTRYINDPYFGGFMSTDEHVGSEAYFDWYSVKSNP